MSIMSIINIVLFLISIDLTSIYINNKFKKQKIDQNTRWFFIHSIGNLIITYNAFPDVMICFNDPLNCYKLSWSSYSYFTFKFSVLIHLYHAILFKLNKADRLHHILMCGICGPLTYYLKVKISILALFFLSGCPGFIDYFLLYLVKLNKLESMYEKYIYVYLITWIRAPGLCFTTLMSIYGLKNLYYDDLNRFLMLLIVAILTFWNGQYYMMRTCIDYGCKLNSRNEFPI